MKKLVLAILLAMVLAPAGVFAWSKNWSEMTKKEMQDAVCRTAIRLDFEVITSMYGSQRETIVRPAQPELFPPNYVFERRVITADSEYAGMIPVGTEVAYQYIGTLTSESGPSTLHHEAGDSTFSGTIMKVENSRIISWIHD